MDVVCSLWLMSSLAVVAAEPEVRFREQVVPILERRCVSCHNSGDPKGGLALDTRASALKGGDLGAPLIPGKPETSLLLDYVSGDAPEMPKNGPPLQPEEVAVLRDWIAAGAIWPEGFSLKERPAADKDWWSLRPLARPTVPEVAVEDAPLVRTPIDRFVLARLRAQGLSLSREADRRTLIRRLSFDLIGLPPRPDAIAAFESDPAPDAYERLVDRLLSSPQYGERWARHWLDVVHYGETHGYDKDQPRPQAWPYRDYVIRAFNDDKPYAQFVREQLAGDVFAPETVDGITALGFIAAGPWDQIGHAEVPETKIDGKIARNLDRDDMVVNTLNTFCSTTVQCARCHAHKFDPVSQVDYYRLQAVFAALDRANRTFDSQPEIGRRRSELLAEQRATRQQLEQLETQVRELAGPRLVEIATRLESLAQQERTGFRAPPEHGYHSAIAPRDDVEKWVQLDLGKEAAISQIALQACFDDFNNIGAGFGFPRRYRIDVSADPEFREQVVTVADRTAIDAPNPGLTRQTVDAGGLLARYVRITATRLAPRQNDYIFSLAEVEVLDASGQNIARTAAVTALDSIEAPIRWRRTNLVDGIYPHTRGSDLAAERARLSTERERLLAERVPAELRRDRDAAQARLAELSAQLQQLPPAQLVYAGTVHHGTGTFRGTGPDGGRPRPIHVLHRGDVLSPREAVEPGAPAFVPGWPEVFPLSEQHPEQARRAALAEWVVDVRNPLTWRSVVNRVWQYHFGRGLVESPNDFGRMGQLPSHPELLDWLAVELRDGGQSLKSLHRLLVTSAVYRQVSEDRSDAAQIDAGNALLWRANRRKLDAEAIRDSLLSVAGRLNLQMEGPSFQDFVIEHPAHSPHYEYRLHDPQDPRAHRRSVYRFLVRSQPQPFMTTLDCADPSMSVDKRNETINALQALALLNNGLTLVAAREFAAELERSIVAATPDRLRTQLTAGFETALGRPPTQEELATLATYAQAHGLANACRLILNLNEFAFVD
ncbi:MAG: DUF1553 domain-containing protein [Planctomycetaceae bacterium]|nr:DUF1553 domain-containing protein [Planctomycetaceae bacterium]